MYSSITPRRSFSRRGVWVWTFMPGMTGVVQLAGVPRAPSISTRHIRHEPNACMLSVAQSFGMSPPISAAARITLVPAGTVTSRPSMVRVTISSDLTSGVPKSAWRSYPIVLLHRGEIRRCIDISRFGAGFHGFGPDRARKRKHRVLVFRQQQRFERVKASRRPVADHRLAFEVSRGGGEQLQQVLRQAHRVDAAGKHAVVTFIAGQAQAGGNPAERTHARVRPVRNAAVARSAFAPSNDDQFAVSRQRVERPRQKRAPAEFGERLVAAEAGRLPTCEDDAEDHASTTRRRSRRGPSAPRLPGRA